MNPDVMEPTCRLCTREGYERIAESAHFVVLKGIQRDDPLYFVPKAHIELMQLHELFAAELWGLIRQVPDGKRRVWISGGDAGQTFTSRGHGYIAVSIDRAEEVKAA